jgi:hypothetical protein
MTLLRRELARRAGVPQRDFARRCRLSFGMVAEYQTRAVLHFHAGIRLDTVNPDERDELPPPPGWASAEPLTEAIQTAVSPRCHL